MSAHALMDGVYPLTLALSHMKLTSTLLNELVGVDWMSFGKKNSHLYRKELMERFDKTGLNGEEKFMVYFLASVVKNQKRMLMGLDSFPAEMKAASWYAKVRAFIDTNLCQYVSQVPKEKKFPAVNIPVTNPGMDLLCWVVWVEPSSLTVTEMFKRPNSSQLALNDMAQSQAKIGYQFYWDSVIKGTRNPDAKNMDLPKPGMNEDYYANAASDKYPLISVRLEKKPVPNDGYSTDDLFNWMLGVKLSLGLVRIAHLNDNTWILVEESKDHNMIPGFHDWVDTLDGYFKMKAAHPDVKRVFGYSKVAMQAWEAARMKGKTVFLAESATTERGRKATLAKEATVRSASQVSQSTTTGKATPSGTS